MSDKMASRLRRFVIFLIRKRLGLNKYEKFQFVGQKSDAVYWFTEYKVMKCWHGYPVESGVSVNWLLHKDCKIKRV